MKKDERAGGFWQELRDWPLGHGWEYLNGVVMGLLILAVVKLLAM